MQPLGITMSDSRYSIATGQRIFMIHTDSDCINACILYFADEEEESSDYESENKLESNENA